MIVAFTVKAWVNSVERSADGSQVKVSLRANYTDPKTGERVNQEWAKYTPSFSNEFWVTPEVVERDGIEAGQGWTLTYEKDGE